MEFYAINKQKGFVSAIDNKKGASFVSNKEVAKLFSQPFNDLTLNFIPVNNLLEVSFAEGFDRIADEFFCADAKYIESVMNEYLEDAVTYIGDGLWKMEGDTYTESFVKDELRRVAFTVKQLVSFAEMHTEAFVMDSGNDGFHIGKH